MILLIDNYDSFSYNLYQLIGEVTPDIKVSRNDKITLNEIKDLNPDAIILSGGITKQGDKLLSPLKERLNSDINVEISALGDDAGIFGAANLI